MRGRGGQGEYSPARASASARDFRLKGREKFYESVAEMQTDLDAYLLIYNTKRPHQGRGMNGTTLLQAFLKGLKLRPKTERKEEPKEAA